MNSKQTAFAVVTKVSRPTGIGSGIGCSIGDTDTKPIPLVSGYRPDTDTEYWYRSKPKIFIYVRNCIFCITKIILLLLHVIGALSTDVLPTSNWSFPAAGSEDLGHAPGCREPPGCRERITGDPVSVTGTGYTT